MRKDYLTNPVFRVLKRQKSDLQNARGACCNDPTVSHLTCDLTPSILGSDALGSRRQLLLA